VPARLAGFDTTSSRMVAVLRSVQDMDDLHHDADRKGIYVRVRPYFISTSSSASRLGPSIITACVSPNL
jgi:hypothetical protein